jgi:hypothetical protein
MGRWLIVAMAWITSVGEQLRRRADADEAGRPQLLHRLDEGGNRRTILSERRLEGGEIAARAHQSRYWHHGLALGSIVLDRARWEGRRLN